MKTLLSKQQTSDTGTKTEAGTASMVQCKLTVGEPGDQYEQEADAVADKVMRMPEQNFVQRKCANCEEEEKKQVQRKPLSESIAPFIQTKSDSGTTVSDSLNSKISSTQGSGSSMDSATQSFMSSRFGADFSNVKIHTGGEAVQMNRELNAKAFTTGNDIYFNEGQYQPGSDSGKHLLAHELVHTVQQGGDLKRKLIQRYSGCTTAQDTMITDDHDRARVMLSNAIAAVSSYNGTTPAKVYNALNTHFSGSTSNAFATWINVNLRFLWGTTWMAGYDCFSNGIAERQWACTGSDLATTFWCVPLVNIRLCPSYFGQSAVERSTTLIHEWIHKYGCNFDLGYEFEPGYSGNSTLSQLLNADSFSSFIRDVQ
jgi:hypothetical protein